MKSKIDKPGQTAGLLSWAYSELTKGVDWDKGKHDDILWYLQAAGVTVLGGHDFQDYGAQEIFELTEQLDANTAHLIAHHVITAALWQPTDRDTFFLEKARHNIMEIEGDSIAA